MNGMELLAQAGAVTTQIVDKQIVPVNEIWKQITALSWLQAVLAVSFGVVYQLYGWRIYRVLVVICFGLVGMFVGIQLGEKMQNPIWGGIFGLAVLAAASMPLMRWCVCILGAAAGGLMTGGLWYAFGLPQIYIWSGAAVGVVAGGMISFIVLKVAVMLFTSMGGTIILVTGVLGLLQLYQVHELKMAADKTDVYRWVHDLKWFLPAALIVPSLLGVYLQNRFIKLSSKWEF